MNASSPTGRIVLLTTSHRVAPGLLSWPAWEALRGADRVVCGDEHHPQLPYVREAGISVDTGPLPTARELVDAAARGLTTVVIAAAEGEQRLTDALASLAGSGRTAMPELELLPGSYDLPGARFIDLVQVMDSIRTDCPWSGAKTHEGLAKYGIEEMYELVEAIEEGDRAALCEELGDVLLQVVFHARIAEEDPEEPFSADDVAGGIVEKLIRRHPHVFGEEQAATADDVREHWLRTKAAEKRRDSVTEGIPLGQPALALTAKLAQRARLAGLDAHPRLSVLTGRGGGAVPGAAGEPAGVSDAAELREPEGRPGAPVPGGEPGGARGGDEGREGGTLGTGTDLDDVGRQLLALAVRAEAEGTDPETALRAAARGYRDAIRAAEGLDAEVDGDADRDLDSDQDSGSDQDPGSD